jgi:hypothetical protein
VAAADYSRRDRVRMISWGGLLTALIVLSLWVSAWSPTADVAIFTFASWVMAISVVELGWRGSLTVFMASGLIGLAWPGFSFAWPYFFFFGPYPLLRALVDRRLKRKTALIVRLLTGFVLSTVLLLTLSRATIGPATDRFGIWIWLIGPASLALAMLIYDWALGLLIHLFMVRLRHR